MNSSSQILSLPNQPLNSSNIEYPVFSKKSDLSNSTFNQDPYPKFISHDFIQNSTMLPNYPKNHAYRNSLGNIQTSYEFGRLTSSKTFKNQSHLPLKKQPSNLIYPCFKYNVNNLIKKIKNKEQMNEFELQEFIILAKRSFRKIDTNNLSPSMYLSNYSNATEELNKIVPLINQLNDEFINNNGNFSVNYRQFYYIFYNIRNNELCRIYLLIVISYFICLKNKNVYFISNTINNILFLIFNYYKNNQLAMFFMRYFLFKHFKKIFDDCQDNYFEKYFFDNIVIMTKLLNVIYLENKYNFDNKDEKDIDYKTEVDNLNFMIIENLNKFFITSKTMNINKFKDIYINKILDIVYTNELDINNICGIYKYTEITDYLNGHEVININMIDSQIGQVSNSNMNNISIGFSVFSSIERSNEPITNSEISEFKSINSTLGQSVLNDENSKKFAVESGEKNNQFNNPLLNHSNSNSFNEQKIYNEFIIDWIIKFKEDNYLTVCLEEILNKFIDIINVDKNLMKKLDFIIKRAINSYKNSIDQAKDQSKPLLINKININKSNNILNVLKSILENKNFYAEINVKIYMEFIYTLFKFIIISTDSTDETTVKKRNNYLNTFLNIFNEYLVYKEIQQKYEIIINDKDKKIEKNKEKNKDKREKNNIDKIGTTLQNDRNESFHILNSKEYIEIYDNIFDLLVKAKVNLFDITNLFIIINHFDSSILKEKCKQILNHISNSIDKLDNNDNCLYVRKLIFCMINTGIYDPNQDYSSEKYLISNFLIKICNPNPEMCIKLIMSFKEIYIKSSPVTIKTLDVFFICILSLNINIHNNYLKVLKNNSTNKNETPGNSPNLNSQNNDNNLENNLNTDDVNKKIEGLNIPKNIVLFEPKIDLNDDKIYIKYSLDLSSYSLEKIINLINVNHSYIKELIHVDFIEYPEQIMPNLLRAISIIDRMQFGRKNFVEIAFYYFCLYLKIYTNKIVDNNEKIEYIADLVNLICNSSILPLNLYLSLKNAILKVSKSMRKRSDTAKILLIISDLFYNKNYKNLEEIKKILSEAQKETEFSLVKIENLYIFLLLIKKYIYFYQFDNTIVQGSNLIYLEKVINEHINDLRESNEELADNICIELCEYSPIILEINKGCTEKNSDNKAIDIDAIEESTSSGNL